MSLTACLLARAGADNQAGTHARTCTRTRTPTPTPAFPIKKGGSRREEQPLTELSATELQYSRGQGLANLQEAHLKHRGVKGGLQLVHSCRCECRGAAADEPQWRLLFPWIVLVCPCKQDLHTQTRHTMSEEAVHGIAHCLHRTLSSQIGETSKRTAVSPTV